ncbi:UDP-glycosyltransferase 86A1-like [Triticum urartu]|uniref:UDP-glycosyltransferase 86A1-like n=1 Tax=Triticum urartu TaxID=4572 RepID=UPI002044B18E|nr:UDP-glycosyltransferase 86A1-like [Triticum urartu]
MAQKEAGVGATSGGGKAKPHAVVVVYPLQGHVIPVTHLALRLAARGFAVTVVNTEAVHDQTARALGVDPAGYDFFAGARASGMDVRYELISDGLPVGFDRSLHHDEFMGSLLHALSGHVEEVLGRVVVDPAATCLVADTFFVWPATLASKFGIAYVSFWTEPALIFNLYYHVHLLTNNGHFGCNGEKYDFWNPLQYAYVSMQ